MSNKQILNFMHNKKFNLRNLINELRFAFLFVLLIIFFILKALSPHQYLMILTSITFFILVIYSLYVIESNKKHLWRLVLIIGALGIILSLVSSSLPTKPFLITSHLLIILFYALMWYGCLYYTFNESVINVTSLFGALCTYLFMGMSFASIFHLVHLIEPGAFTGMGLSKTEMDEEFTYFSFVTLTTLGYGDIKPLSSLAKTLSWLEAYLGQAYLTIMMALLVGRYLGQNQRN